MKKCSENNGDILVRRIEWICNFHGGKVLEFRIYIDEVGNIDLKNSDKPNHRFLSLTGVIVDLEYVRNVISPELEAFKSKYFDSHPDEPVVLHRKEILNRRGPFSRLRDENVRASFDKELLRKLRDWHYRVITVCLDKKKHRDQYTVWLYHPYHYCLLMMLERYVWFLEQYNSVGDAMAESRGGKEDRKLKEAFNRIWIYGSDYIDSGRFQAVLRSRQLRVKPKSNNISGLQLADMIAHPSRNEILKDSGFDQIRLGDFAKKVIGLLGKKYYQKDGKVFGKKFQ